MASKRLHKTALKKAYIQCNRRSQRVPRCVMMPGVRNCSGSSLFFGLQGICLCLSNNCASRQQYVSCCGERTLGPLYPPSGTDRLGNRVALRGLRGFPSRALPLVDGEKIPAKVAGSANVGKVRIPPQRGVSLLAAYYFFFPPARPSSQASPLPLRACSAVSLSSQASPFAFLPEGMLP